MNEFDGLAKGSDNINVELSIQGKNFKSAFENSELEETHWTDLLTLLMQEEASEAKTICSVDSKGLIPETVISTFLSSIYLIDDNPRRLINLCSIKAKSYGSENGFNDLKILFYNTLPFAFTSNIDAQNLHNASLSYLQLLEVPDYILKTYELYFSFPNCNSDQKLIFDWFKGLLDKELNYIHDIRKNPEKALETSEDRKSYKGFIIHFAYILANYLKEDSTIVKAIPHGKNYAKFLDERNDELEFKESQNFKKDVIRLIYTYPLIYIIENISKIRFDSKTKQKLTELLIQYAIKIDKRFLK